MQCEEFFYNCSEEYVNRVDPCLLDEIRWAIECLPKREKQSEVNNDLFWLFTNKDWSFDTLANVSSYPPADLNLERIRKEDIERDRSPCLTATTLHTNWHCDFAKIFDTRLVQIEAQFGKVESMFKDFCGFMLARYERRLALGIEIVLSNPQSYFAHRRNAIGGMAYFEIAKKTLPAIGLDCPIWLIGVKE